MKKLLFWVVLLLGAFFTIASVIGTAIETLAHTFQLVHRVTIGAIPVLLVGAISEFVLNFITMPIGLLGITLLALAKVLKKKL